MELWNYGDTWHNTQWNEELGANVIAPWGGSALVRGGEGARPLLRKNTSER